MTAVLDAPAITEHCHRIGQFTVRESANGPGTYRLELTGPDVAEPIVFRCHGEIAMALNVSGAQLHEGLSDEQVASATATGVRTIGLELIRTLIANDRALNLREIDDRLTRLDRQAKAAIWSSQREELCLGLALRVRPPRGTF